MITLICGWLTPWFSAPLSINQFFAFVSLLYWKSVPSLISHKVLSLNWAHKLGHSLNWFHFHWNFILSFYSICCFSSHCMPGGGLGVLLCLQLWIQWTLEGVQLIVITLQTWRRGWIMVICMCVMCMFVIWKLVCLILINLWLAQMNWLLCLLAWLLLFQRGLLLLTLLHMSIQIRNLNLMIWAAGIFNVIEKIDYLQEYSMKLKNVKIWPIFIQLNRLF